MNLKNVLKYFIYGPEILQWYRLSTWLWGKGRLCRIVSVIYKRKINVRFSCFLSPQAQIGEGLKLPHPVGIVIGDGVQIGKRVIIYQGVTIGAGRVGEGVNGLYPKIGNDVIIYAGAKVIGNINIGDGAVIGANAVVIADVPKGGVVVGVPARLVGKSQ